MFEIGMLSIQIKMTDVRVIGLPVDSLLALRCKFPDRVSLRRAGHRIGIE